MNKTKIEWTNFTANPLKYRTADGKVVWGCVHASEGCRHCYSEALAHRYGRGGPFTAATMAGLTPFMDEKELRSILTYKPATGKMCFVGDMTDIFGEWVPFELLDKLFAVFALRPDVTFQVLTKRPERMREYIGDMHPGSPRVIAIRQATTEFLSFCSDKTSAIRFPLPNVWLGTSCEDQPTADARIPLLLQTPAAIRFVSYEPALEAVDFRHHLVDNPIYEKTSRGDRLHGGYRRGIGDRYGRPNMENQEARVESMGERSSQPSMPESEGRERYRAIPSGGSDVRPEVIQHGSAQASLSAFQGSDTRRTDDKSRRREQEAQPPEQFDAGNIFRTADPCNSNTESGSRLQSARDRELNACVDLGTSRTDQDAESDRRTATIDIGGFRDRISDGIENSQNGPQISWLIIGGESGPKARPFDIGWVRSTIEQCRNTETLAFVKQLGSRPYWDVVGGLGRFAEHVRYRREPIGDWILLKDKKGGDMSEWPEDLRVRELPEISK